MNYIGNASVGSVWPFLLGLPLGGLGGYFYRGWRDAHPGQWIPGFPMDHAAAAASGGPPHVGGPWLDIDQAGQVPYVGGPWLDIETAGTQPYVGGPWLDIDMAGNPPHVGGPWLDIDMAGNVLPGASAYGTDPYVGGPWADLVGADMDVRERRRTWAQTRALIESAKREVIDAQAATPAAAWVWSLDPPGLGRFPGAVIEGSSQVTPFSSVEQAQAYMFERFHTPHVALALFDTAATRHWPNPVRWTKSDDPAYAPLIAQRAAQYAPARMAGDFVGLEAQAPSVDGALRDVRRRAQTIANKRAGDVVGVIHTTKDDLWHAYAFRNEDDADDWLASQDQVTFTYAAYFDRDDATWPHPVIEKIGGLRVTKRPRASVGAALDETRVQAKSLATAKAGNAVGVVRLVDGSWATVPFRDLDAAIDWLGGLTAHRANFTYAGAFEKGPDGTAYVQQEEFGTRPGSASQRALAATSGEHRGKYTWRAA